MANDEDADVQRKYYERVQRSREMTAPADDYGMHQFAWDWRERMLALRQGAWSAFGKAWEPKQ